MDYIHRIIEKKIKDILARGKSILLLGPRQTGKTTLIEHQIQPDIYYTFAKASIRQRYERDIVLFERELEAEIEKYDRVPLVAIDEVQKIPQVMDTIQTFIDSKSAQFILTGSSARKLKHGSELNLLPGRVVNLTMAPLLYTELPEPKLSIENIILYGTLPNIIRETDSDKEDDLFSYVTTYLEEEIRAEAAVRNVGAFSRFLQIAAGESGKPVNYSKLSQDIGVSDSTISSYYQVLVDCLIATRIDPITKSETKRRLIRSPMFLFFDLGIRRACANEGVRLPQKTLGSLFEQYVGNELLNQGHIQSKRIHVKYWRDAAGPEVDYVLEVGDRYLPIEVKWSDKPGKSDARHLRKFLSEYETAEQAFIICRTPRRYKLEDNITVIPWQELGDIFRVFL